MNDSQTIYVRNIVEFAKNDGYDVVVINYRGMAGINLHTPKLYSSFAWQDISEPIEYIHKKYCQNLDKKLYAIGCSLGSMILANMLG
jgi:predicted alpha/beta-fold hydrolase